MLIEKIRAVTSKNHEMLEAALFPFLKTIQQPSEYALLLKAFYGYIQPVQELVAANIDRSLMPDIDERRNASLILDDLKILGENDEPEKAGRLPVIDSNAAAFGALYVLEGSTLGGKIISRMISEKLGTSEGLSFFKGYGAETGKMWKIFTQQLEAAPNVADAETVVQSAKETFILFGTWLENNIPVNKN